MRQVFEWYADGFSPRDIADALNRGNVPAVIQAVGPRDFPFEASSGFTHVAARRLADPPKAGRCPEGFSESVTLLAASVATGANRQFPQAGLAPASRCELPGRDAP